MTASLTIVWGSLAPANRRSLGDCTRRRERVVPPSSDRGGMRPLRIALLLQAAGLLLTIALTVPDYLDGLLHPRHCTSWCFDFRGLAFYFTSIFLGPVILLMLLLAWRWRGPRRWPLLIVVVLDAAAVLLVAGATISFIQSRTDSIPTVASAPPLLLLPALATLLLGINLVRPLPWKPLVAVSAAGCLLVAPFLWLYAVRPVHQRIPGEMSLPFSRVVGYEGRDLGCRNYDRGWVRQRECTNATLVVYRGSGDAYRDQATINQVLLAQKRLQPNDVRVRPLPVVTGVNHSESPDVDARNTGLCLMITDRLTPAPSTPAFPFRPCGTPADYADIQSHWPADDAYAIGIIYYYSPAE